MPDESVWEGFFNPNKIFELLELNTKIKDVVDFGCGYGTFTIPAAKIISGKVYTLDIDQNCLNILNKKIKNDKNLHNIVPIHRDFISDGSGLDNNSVDYVMLFNILHTENPTILLKEAHRILKDNGLLGIIHWRYDASTPRGPSLDIRPKPEDCIDWSISAGFEFKKTVDLKPYHYGLLMGKKSELSNLIIQY